MDRSDGAPQYNDSYERDDRNDRDDRDGRDERDERDGRDAMMQDRARSRSPGAPDARSSGRNGGSYRERADRSERPRHYGDRAGASQHAAHEASRKSQKDCRVYVGNLSYGVKWNTLKDFMREGA